MFAIGQTFSAKGQIANKKASGLGVAAFGPRDLSADPTTSTLLGFAFTLKA